MTEKYSRAQRRADYARLKNNRQFHWGYGHIDEWAGRTPDVAGEINHMSPAIAGQSVTTPTPCSCYMCGNPRKHSWGENPLTMQEQRAYNAYKDGLWEVEDTATYRAEKYDAYYEEDWYYNEQEEHVKWYLRWMYYKHP